jgi:hypothetical protein
MSDCNTLLRFGVTESTDVTLEGMEETHSSETSDYLGSTFESV